jgi:hypothetical protein
MQAGLALVACCALPFSLVAYKRPRRGLLYPGTITPLPLYGEMRLPRCKDDGHRVVVFYIKNS